MDFDTAVLRLITLRSLQDAASRLAHRVQLTTDGYTVYLEAVDGAFAQDIDFATLGKVYGASLRNQPREYSAVSGDPDPAHASTSYVERQNLTMRTNMRRYTRQTNACSKKLENLKHAVALHYLYYNFVRIHQSSRVMPAMEAGITEQVWEIVELVQVRRPRPGKRGPYKKRT